MQQFVSPFNCNMGSEILHLLQILTSEFVELVRDGDVGEERREELVSRSVDSDVARAASKVQKNVLLHEKKNIKPNFFFNYKIRFCRIRGESWISRSISHSHSKNLQLQILKQSFLQILWEPMNLSGIKSCLYVNPENTLSLFPTKSVDYV